MKTYILDTTGEGSPDHPEEAEKALQACVAASLHMTLQAVQAGWLPISLVETRLAYTPGQHYIPTAAIIRSELEKVAQAIHEPLQHVVLVFSEDETGVNSVSAALAVEVYTLTGQPPTVIGVQRVGRKWGVVDLISPHEEQL